MLEHVPAWLGSLLRTTRAGHGGLVAADPAIGTSVTFTLESPAFADGARLPERFTADGDGISPPLVWGDVPDGTASLALVVEDPDAPAPRPLVHAILWDLPPDTRRLAEGAIGPDVVDTAGGAIGRNSYLQQGWLPPDPPTGHGTHDYVFQLFALADQPELGRHPGRGEVVDALADRVLAVAVLTGTYSRDEPAGPDATVVSGSLAPG